MLSTGQLINPSSLQYYIMFVSTMHWSIEYGVFDRSEIILQIILYISFSFSISFDSCSHNDLDRIGRDLGPTR